ncbi:MAG: hypothetical protein PHR35_17430, partial [Kiritimatiellae bacterium]|nr:hypothetical protein [Kiritimatiellia bacterium]
MPPACWSWAPVLVVYLLTLSRGLFPDGSAALVASAAGLIRPCVAIHPVWETLAKWVACLPCMSLPFRLNLFGALVGALTAGIFGGLIERWLLRASQEPRPPVFSSQDEDDEPEAPPLPDTGAS